jgi:hypothetical protein
MTEERKAAIERVARQMAIDCGMNPDELFSSNPPHMQNTPFGVVYSVPSHPAPMWTYFRRAAVSAMNALHPL